MLTGFLLVGTSHGQTLVRSLIPKEGALVGGGGGESSGLDAAARTVEAAVRTQDISVQQRAASYLVALRVFKEHPILGAGLGTSGFYMERYWPGSFVPLPKNRPAIATMLSHYAIIAAETGLLGLLCLGAFALAVITRLFWLARQGPGNRALAWGLAASLGGYAIGAAAYPLMAYQFLLVWLLLAMALRAELPEKEAVDLKHPS